MQDSSWHVEMFLVSLQLLWASADSFQGKQHCEFWFRSVTLYRAEWLDAIKMFDTGYLERSSADIYLED